MPPDRDWYFCLKVASRLSFSQSASGTSDGCKAFMRPSTSFFARKAEPSLAIFFSSVDMELRAVPLLCAVSSVATADSNAAMALSISSFAAR